MDKSVEVNNLIKNYKNLGQINTKNISDTNHSFGLLYKQRMVLFSALCNSNPGLAWKSKKHFDEENDPMFNDDFIAGILTPQGQATFHFKLEYWNLFHIKELENAPKYDNCSPEDVLRRLLSINASGDSYKL